MPRNNDIQFRRGTSTEWSNANPVLSSGEPGFDITNDVLKIGDGSTSWTGLSEFAPFNTNLIAGTGISLVYNSGNSTLSINSSGTGGGLANIVEDSTPQLGGNLDLNSSSITGVGNINISGDITANTGNLDVLSFNVNNESILTKGQISWDDTEGTMDIGLTDNTTIHIGSHRYFRIRNETGGTLYKGQVVYASGVHANGIIEPALYVADGTVREVRFMGVVLENVNNQNNGYVVDFGHLENMDLDGSATNYAVGDETWSAGDILYVHPTGAGKLTKNEPKHSISVAIVLDPGNGNGNGRMFVRPISYGHLDDNHDVAVSGATNGQFLQYNSVTDYWVPSSSGNFTTLQVNGTLVPTGVGTSNYVTKWTGTNSIGNSVVYDNGTNVGIGTASPSSKLHVVGNATFDASSGVPVTITNTGTGNSFVVNDGAGDTTPFVVDADGKVGIRGATPSSLHSLFNTLCVGTGGAAAQGITIFSQSVCTLAFGDTAAGDSADSARGYVAYSHTTDTLTIGTNNATRITVDSSGRVGIGTNPSYVLHVNGAIATTTGDVYVLGGGVRITRSSNPFILFTEGASGVGQLRASSSQLRMTDSTGASVFFALDTGSGNVGIGTGTTSPASRLDVNGVITVSATSGSAGSYAPSLTISGDSNTGFGQVSGQSDTASVFTAGHERVRVDANGNVGIGASFGTTTRLLVGGSLSGTGTNYVVLTSPTAQSAVTNLYGFLSSPAVASDCSLASLFHFSAQQGTYSGTVSGQIGFWAHSGLTGATNNYGFRSDIASGTGRWNFYGLGTAPNYFAGNVGIGSGRTSPASALDVNGVITVAAGTAAAPAIVAAGDPNTGVWFPTGGDRFAISTDGLERLRINNLGNVGIGTNSPSARLNVEGGNVIFNDLGGNFDFRVEGDTDTNLLFTDASTDKVGIGTSSPSYKLDVVGTGNFSQNLLVNGTPVSVSGHVHTTGDITGFASGVADVVNTTLVAGTGIDFDYNAGTDTLTINTSGVADNAITYDKLSDSATESDNVQKRVAKAWVNFNGTSTVSIRASFNVSSITDDGVGNYIINFTNAMPDVNYVATIGSTASTSNAYVSHFNQQNSGSIRCYFLNYTNGAGLDQSMVSVVIFR